MSETGSADGKAPGSAGGDHEASGDGGRESQRSAAEDNAPDVTAAMSSEGSMPEQAAEEGEDAAAGNAEEGGGEVQLASSVNDTVEVNGEVRGAHPRGSAAGGSEGGEEGDDLSGRSAAELRALVRAMRAEHAEALDTEARARAEVEDMCLRIEKHFKAEKAWSTAPTLQSRTEGLPRGA